MTTKMDKAIETVTNIGKEIRGYLEGKAPPDGSQYGSEELAALTVAIYCMKTYPTLIKDCEQAVKRHDWKVDGACDPDLEGRRAALENYLKHIS